MGAFLMGITQGKVCPLEPVYYIHKLELRKLKGEI